MFRLQQESKSVIEATDKREKTSQKTAREKRKSGSSAIDEQSPAKRQKNTSQYQKKLHEKENTQGKNVAEANDGEGKKGKVDKPVNEQQMKDTGPGKTRLYTDQCTAFISNLDYKASRLPSCLLPLICSFPLSNMWTPLLFFILFNVGQADRQVYLLG